MPSRTLVRLRWMAAAAGLSLGCQAQPSPAPSPTPTPVVTVSTAAPAATAVAGAKVAGKALYSQHDEELIVRDFFKDRRDGIFLDVGCASPITDSNTYYLEKHLGWSGLAVDALPEFAQAWERKRPRSRFFNFLVSDHADTVEPFYRSSLRGTSSVSKDAGAMRGPGGKKVEFDTLHVPTTTLTRLLDTNKVDHVDFLSLDIEGWEPQALAGFDIERFKLGLACVEAKPANRQKLLDYFTAHGYRRLERYQEQDPVNYYFAPRGAS